MVRVDVPCDAGSLFLTAGGMSAVVTSLAAAQFVYVFGVGVRWVGLLNFLGVFIIMGIGADDIFVILDFWRQSAEQHDIKSSLSSSSSSSSSLASASSTAAAAAAAAGAGAGTTGTAASCTDCGRGGRGVDVVLVSRMRWTIENSMYVVTMTSLTTAVAFACNLASNIAPIRLFGAGSVPPFYTITPRVKYQRIFYFFFFFRIKVSCLDSSVLSLRASTVGGSSKCACE